MTDTARAPGIEPSMPPESPPEFHWGSALEQLGRMLDQLEEL
jgi:hypothetical protein